MPQTSRRQATVNYSTTTISCPPSDYSTYLLTERLANIYADDGGGNEVVQDVALT